MTKLNPVDTRRHTGWGLLWRSKNRISGKVDRIIGRFNANRDHVPIHMEGHKIMVFKTRREARAFRDEKYGYIATRPDLRAEPHGWKMPSVVAVNVVISVKL